METIQPSDALFYIKEKLDKSHSELLINEPKFHMTGCFGDIGTERFIEFEVTYSDESYHLSVLTRNVLCVSYTSDDIIKCLYTLRGVKQEKLDSEDAVEDLMTNDLDDDHDATDPDFDPRELVKVEKELNGDTSGYVDNQEDNEVDSKLIETKLGTKRYFPKDGKRLEKKLRRSLEIQNKVMTQGLVKCEFCDITFKKHRTNCYKKHLFNKHRIVDGQPVSAMDEESVREKLFKKLFNCETCKKAFSSTATYKKHMAKVHNEIIARLVKPKEVMCPFCGKLHGKEGQKFADHLRYYHGEEDLSHYQPLFDRLNQVVKEKTICTICGISVSSLYLHLRTHNKDLHQCKKCGQKFANQNSLWRHTKFKHGNQRALCSDCGDEFENEYRLRRHQLRVHLKKKNFQCAECEKRFFAQDKLKLHVSSVHRKEKNFPCDFCSFRCARIDNLNLHRRKSHNATYKLKMEDVNKIIENGGLFIGNEFKTQPQAHPSVEYKHQPHPSVIQSVGQDDRNHTEHDRTPSDHERLHIHQDRHHIVEERHLLEAERQIIADDRSKEAQISLQDRQQIVEERHLLETTERQIIAHERSKETHPGLLHMGLIMQERLPHLAPVSSLID